MAVTLLSELDVVSVQPDEFREASFEEEFDPYHETSHVALAGSCLTGSGCSASSISAE